MNSPAQALYNQATERYEQADYAAARTLYERALAIYELELGVTRPDTARCLNRLGMTLAGLGDYAAAQSSVERALAIREQSLGVNHPDTAESLHWLGDIQFDRGEFAAGRALVEQAFEIRQRTLGAEHPETIESMRIAAGMQAYQGDRARAEQRLDEALSICERVFGENHLSTAKVLNGLGVLWAADKSTYARARSAYERSLAINERLLGPEHPDTARSLNNLAAVLADMGQDATGLALLERSLTLHEKLYGSKHYLTSFVLLNLADLYKKQRDYAAARPLLERALIAREQILGARHPETIRSLRKLVATLSHLHQQGDQRAMLVAMPLDICLRALEAAAGHLPSDQQHMPGARQDPAKAAEQLHQWVAKLEADMNRPPLSAADQAELQTAHDLRREADARYDQGDYAATQALLEQALAIQERRLGQNHLDHVELIRKLARTKEKQGQYSAILSMMQRVADIRVEALGPSHPTTVAALTDLAMRYYEEYDLEASLPLQEQILKLMEDTLGPDDYNVVMMRDSLNRWRDSSAPSQHPDQQPRLSRSEKLERALATLPLEPVALLTGLDDIHWHDLQHAYGPADDVPNLLRMLLADDESVRDNAWQRLYSSVIHQGTVYEASAFVVPFILKMLVSDGPPDKADLLQFLASLAEGSSYLAAHAQPDEDQNRWREILAKQGLDFETELQAELAHVKAANRAVSEGAPIYLALLDHEDAEIRHLSLGVLASSRAWAGEIVPRLCALLATVRDAEMRVKIADALDALMDDGVESQQFFAELMQRRENERVTLLAALALIKRAREQAPEAAVNAVLNAVQELGQARRDNSASEDEKAMWESLEDRFYPDWRWSGCSSMLTILTQLGPTRATTVLLRMLSMIQDGGNALEAASTLLDLVFNEGQIQIKRTAFSSHGEGAQKRTTVEYWEPKPQPPREAFTLTDTQRTVLAALVAHDPVWEYQHNLLGLYGLPMTREELRQYEALDVSR